MNETMLREKVHQAVDSHCAHLKDDYWLAQRVIAMAQEPEAETSTVHRRKLPVALIVLIVLMLMSVTAVAAVVLSNHIAGFAALESQYGPYDEWPVSARVEMVKIMIENERSLDAAKTQRLLSGVLTEQAQGSLADEILDEYFAGDPHLSTSQVMEHEIGSFASWTMEQKAFYTALMEKYGMQGYDWPRYLLPGDDDLAVNEAVAIATSALYDKFGIALDSYDLRVSFVNHTEYSDYGDQIVWDIRFCMPEYPEYWYDAIINRDGEVVALNAPGTPTLFADENQMEGAVPAVPQPWDASEEDAIESAKHAMTEMIGYDRDVVDSMAVHASFFYHERFCNGKEPVWVITFSTDEGEECDRVLLGYDGLFIDTAQAGKDFAYTFARRLDPEDQYFPNGIVNEQGHGVASWSHAERAAFTVQWKPVVDEYLQTNPYYANRYSHLYYLTRGIYGIPDSSVISEERAISIAREAAIAAGASEAGFEERRSVQYYDVSDEGHPVWRVYFTPSSSPLGEKPSNHWKVVMDAHTGEVQEARILIHNVDILYPYY